jgi:hypothetical protein
MWRLLLPIGVACTATIAAQALLAARLQRHSSQGVSHFRCFWLLNPVASWRFTSSTYASLPAPVEGEAKAFIERLITYRMILVGTMFLLWAPTVGAVLYLGRLNR